MTDTVTYIQGANLDPVSVTWSDDDGSLRQLATGWDLEVIVWPEKVTWPAKTIARSFTKTSGVTGADTAPNVVIDWEPDGEISSLNPGLYNVLINATDGDGDRASMDFKLRVREGAPVDGYIFDGGVL